MKHRVDHKRDPIDFRRSVLDIVTRIKEDRVSKAKMDAGSDEE